MGSKSFSQNISKKTFNTRNETSIRDIGLTGQGAVDLAAVNGATTIALQGQSTTALRDIVQTAGANFNQLIGGASDLISTTEAASGKVTKISEIAAELAGQSLELARNVTEGAFGVGESALAVTAAPDRAPVQPIPGPESAISKAIPLLIIGALGLAFAIRG